MNILHRQLIRDSADLVDMTLETLTEASMAAMSALVDRMEAKLVAAGAMPATAPA